MVMHQTDDDRVCMEIDAYYQKLTDNLRIIFVSNGIVMGDLQRIRLLTLPADLITRHNVMTDLDSAFIDANSLVYLAIDFTGYREVERKGNEQFVNGKPVFLI
jgi:hypothetical protein